MHVPSGFRATDTMADEHTSHEAAPLAYEHVPVQYGSQAVQKPKIVICSSSSYDGKEVNIRLTQ